MNQETTTAMKNGADNVKKISESVGEDFRQAASSLAHGVESIRRKTKEVGQEKFLEAGLQVESFIQKYPVRALAAAAGVGLLIGWMTKKK
jgi:ElaB/YqjD/DUF883 family membrane-anchored ribosome-binding protein